MPALQEQHAHDSPQTFRLDVQLHELLSKPSSPRPILISQREAEAKTLPEPVFPQQ